MPVSKISRHIQRQSFAAEDVEMQVRHGLTRVGAAVADHPVASRQPLRRRDLGDDLKNVGDDGAVFFRDAVAPEMWVLGITRMWVGAWGWMSRKAKTKSSS